MKKVGTIDVYEDEAGSRYITEDGVTYIMIYSKPDPRIVAVDTDYFRRKR